jgi:hypothetical protein
MRYKKGLCGWYIVRLFKIGRHLLIISLFMVFMLYGFSAAALSTKAEKAKYSEYKVKAAFLYNFTKFVEWPAEVFADPSLPISICIVGQDPFGKSIDTIKDKTVKERKLLIRRYPWVEDLKACNLIFISPSENKNLAGILEKIKDMHMLTVSDMEGFADRGGMIHLNKGKNKIRLEINIDAVKQSGLKVSSKLLNIATIIGKANSD